VKWSLVCLLLVASSVASAEPGEGWRAGALVEGGGVFPTTTPTVGATARAGLQHDHYGFLAELGFAAGSARRIDDPTDRRTSLVFLFHLTPTVELDVYERRGFVSAGLVLGVGNWTHTTHRMDAAGAVHSQSIGAPATGVLGFLSGLDVRGGWRLGGGAHHLTVAADVRVLAAPGREASHTISSTGEIEARDTSHAVFAVIPMVLVGYDFK
jgi:hypothetical protein